VSVPSSLAGILRSGERDDAPLDRRTRHPPGALAGGGGTIAGRVGGAHGGPARRVVGGRAAALRGGARAGARPERRAGGRAVGQLGSRQLGPVARRVLPPGAGVRNGGRGGDAQPAARGAGGPDHDARGRPARGRRLGGRDTLMLCDNCKEREVEIHLTKVENDTKVTLHLCRHCAQQKGFETGESILKSPPGAAGATDPRLQLLELKEQLRRAVENENFELAAELRDRIRVLE